MISKFMHGCAVLFPDVAQEVPCWVEPFRSGSPCKVRMREMGAVAHNNSRRVKPQPPTNGAPNGALNGASDPTKPGR